ncbi:Uma2 family endonuclease [Nostoc sp. C117]|uniref:Uma2 family endonuclease n=1 Tax=Nostoc sp. C117 TaxID=3349875 RepID=UPI00370D8911
MDIILVVEVVSSGIENRSGDYRYKRTEYPARGITEYWIVDSDLKQITLCKWVQGQYEDIEGYGDHCIRYSTQLGIESRAGVCSCESMREVENRESGYVVS